MFTKRKIESSVETITPKIAAELLLKNPQNRSLRSTRVKELASEIKHGTFALNGETIIVDWDGNICNGQHRLHAVISANMPIESVVVRGVDPTTKSTIDTGSPRSLADVFTMSGEQGGRNKAAACSAIHTWRQKTCHYANDNRSSVKLNHTEGLEMYYSDRENIDFACKYGAQGGFAPLKTRDTMFGTYLLCKKYGREEIEESLDEFYEYLTQGGDYRGSPTFIMSRIVRERKESHSAGKISRIRREDLYIFLHCFEKWRNKEKISGIRVKTLINNAGKLYTKYWI